MLNQSYKTGKSTRPTSLAGDNTAIRKMSNIKTKTTIRPTENIQNLKKAIPGLLAFILLASILAYPKEAYNAALSGLEVFLKSVFPALLPFFIASEIMTGLGVVDFLSVLLNPVMSPLFRCSGSSSFIWVMSATSGYPSGPRLVAMFRKQNKVDEHEGQRILSFCSTSGPLFMVGAVAIGMLGSPQSGRIIMISHYAAAILLGLLFRFYRSKDRKKESSDVGIKKALSALNESRERDGRPFGELLGDAVRNSVNVLLVVGGFIMLFSVVIDLMMKVNAIDYLAIILSYILKPLNIDSTLIEAVLGGLLEMTTGSRLISQTAVTLQEKIAAVSFLIGWSGFSIHAQAASLLSGSGTKIGVYLLGKLLHGVIAAAISYPLTAAMYPEATEVISQAKPITNTPGWHEIFMGSLDLLGFALIGIVFISILSYLWTRIKKAAI